MRDSLAGLWFRKSRSIATPPQAIVLKILISLGTLTNSVNTLRSTTPVKLSGILGHCIVCIFAGASLFAQVEQEWAANDAALDNAIQWQGFALDVQGNVTAVAKVSDGIKTVQHSADGREAWVDEFRSNRSEATGIAASLQGDTWVSVLTDSTL